MLLLVRFWWFLRGLSHCTRSHGQIRGQWGGPACCQVYQFRWCLPEMGKEARGGPGAPVDPLWDACELKVRGPPDLL